MEQNLKISFEGIDELSHKVDRIMQILEKDQKVKQDEDPLMDLQEAAGFLKLKPATIYNLVHKDELPHMKAGKRLVFKKSALNHWLSKKTEEARQKQNDSLSNQIAKLNQSTKKSRRHGN
jgi:excisionase family DNA binding protein